MKLVILLPTILLVACGASRGARAASLGDVAPADDVPAEVPCEGESGACDGEPIPAKLEEAAEAEERESGGEAVKEALREQAEEEAEAPPEVVEAELERQELPYDAKDAEEEVSDVVDVKSASQAQRVADESLLKALDTVIARNETLEDVMRSEAESAGAGD